MTSFQGWIIIAELVLLLFVLADNFYRPSPRKPKTVEIEITRIGDGFIHGRDSNGKQYAVDFCRIVDGNEYPKVGDIVRVF